MKSKIKFENIISTESLYSNTSNDMSNKKRLELERLFLNRIKQSVELIKTNESVFSKANSTKTIVTTIKDVTFYNGYSILYATFSFRKSDLLRDPSFISRLDSLLHVGYDDDVLLDAPVKRILCRMALRKLSARSVSILVDSYKCASELFSR